jgi:outer membrane lipoprotein SlyB
MDHPIHELPARRFAVLATIATCSSLFLTGCQTPGANLKSNVYSANQVNTAQEAKVVNILAVMPAQIEADNSQNKKTAMIAAGVLGAIGGGLIGNAVSGYSAAATAIGSVAGGAGGVAAGSIVSDKTLVEGVSIAYEYEGKTLNSAQVGKLCEYTPGKAVVISTSPTETRIQPNATCPAQ